MFSDGMRDKLRIEDIQKIFRKMIAPIQRKVLLTIGRGIILATKDSNGIQLIQASLLEGETKDDVEKMHQFGFSSHAPKGSDCLMVSVGGNRDHGIIIATESRQYRFKDLGEGEAVLYSQSGDFVHMKDGNVIDIQTDTLNIKADTVVNIETATANITASTVTNITSPETNISGDLNVGGDTEITGEVTALASVIVTEDVTATGDVTGDNVVGVTSAGAPSIAAATSLTVAGTELKDYQTHNHTYSDDNGTTQVNKTTGGVN